MARYVKSGTVNTVQEINSELEKIATAQDEFLTRNGEAPNEMKNTLDMNSNRITNLPAPTNGSDAARFADVGGGTFTVLTDEALVFDNILEMTTADLVAGQYVRCKRYYSGGGLVEGLVYEVQASATVDNFIDHANANGTFSILISNDISLKKAGAVGDGVASDSLAVQAAFDYSAQYRTKIKESDGTYRLTQGVIVKSNTHFEGSDSVTFVQDYQVIVEPKSESLFRNESWNSALSSDEHITLTNFKMTNGASITGGSFITFNKCNYYNIKNIYARKSSENTCLNIGGYGIVLDNITIENFPDDAGKIDGIHFEYIEDSVLSNLHIHSQDDCLGFAYFPAIIPPRSPAEAIANVEAGRDLPAKNITVTNCVLFSDIASAIRVGNWANFEDLNQYYMPEARFENMTFSNIVFNKVGATGGCIIMEDSRRPANITQPNNNISFNGLVINDLTSATDAMIVVNGNAFTMGLETYAIAGSERNYNNISFSNIKGTHASPASTFNINAVSNLTVSDVNIQRTVADNNEFITQLVDFILIDGVYLNSLASTATGNAYFFRDFIEIVINGGRVTGSGLEVAAIRLQQPNLLNGGRLFVDGCVFRGVVDGVNSVSGLVLDELYLDATMQGITGNEVNSLLSATVSNRGSLQSLNAGIDTVTVNNIRRTNNLCVINMRFNIPVAIGAGQTLGTIPAGLLPANADTIRFFIIDNAGATTVCDYGRNTGIRTQAVTGTGVHHLNIVYSAE